MSASLNVSQPEQGPTNKSFLSDNRNQINKLITVSIFLLLFGLFWFQLWLHIYQTSPTWDEPIHTWSGYSYWQCGNYALSPDQPPFLKMLATLPIKFQQTNDISKPCNLKEGLWAGGEFLKKNGFDRVLIPARLAASTMSLLLAILVFLAAWEMFGKIEAFIALAILAFEPNLIAHGSLVTTDMAATATMFASAYALYRYCKYRSIARLLLTGLLVGIMLVSKHSGLLMVPILLLLLVADTLLFRRDKIGSDLTERGKSVLLLGASFAVIFIIALVVMWATYGFRYQALPKDSTDKVSFNEFLDPTIHPKVASSASGKIIKFIYRNRILPQAYTLGFASILGAESRGMYLLGKWYPTGQWFYFPIAFTIKSSIALLLLFPLALLTFQLYRKYPREMLFLLLPSLGYFAISLTSRLNIGVRHILPVYPFFIIIAAAGAYALARRYRVFFIILCALLLFHIFSAVRIAPNYIAFANDFWGGTNNAHRLLYDSNVEWAQNLKLINAYVEKQDSKSCWFAPWGWVDILNHYQPCHLIPGAMIMLQPDQVPESIPPVIEGTVFVSTAAATPPADAYWERIFKTKPIAILGGSILVFQGRYEVPEIAARSHVERAAKLISLKRFDEAIIDSQKAIDLTPSDSGTRISLASALTERAFQFIELKRFDEAVMDGRKAVELAPNSPRAHLSLGAALIHTVNGKDEARREIEEAIRLAKSNVALYESTERQANLMLQHLQ